MNRQDHQTDARLQKTTGAVFVGASLLMMACFVALGVKLGYPDILRQETAHVLKVYLEAGYPVRLLYYGLVLAAVLVVLESVLFARVFEAPENGVLLQLGKCCGVCAGAFFILGFMRWVFLVPYLAATHADPAASQAVRDTAALLFRAFDTYLGFSLGEHIGFLFLSLMLIFFGLALKASSLAPAWLGWCGVLIGLGVLYGDAEAFNMPLAFKINRVATKLSLAWMILVGVLLLLGKIPRQRSEAGQGPASASSIQS